MFDDAPKRSKIRRLPMPSDCELGGLPLLRVVTEDEPAVDLEALRMDPQRKQMAKVSYRPRQRRRLRQSDANVEPTPALSRP